MLESLINPKKVEKGPWKMVFVGLFYAFLSIFLTKIFFPNGSVLSKYSGVLIVTFSVLFTLPFFYFMIKKEEIEDEQVEGLLKVWKVHKNFVYGFLWLFLGFIIAFSVGDVLLKDPTLLNAQIQTYCNINAPSNIQNCVSQYTNPQIFSKTTGHVAGFGMFTGILTNNIYVMIFTLLFSLIFGAGAIFVLSWNASVIAAAINIFTNYKLSELPLGLLRYMIHGFPEIASYFITALAGGILGAEIIRNGFKGKAFSRVLENSILLLFLALVILIFAAVIEVYFTPLFFN